MTTTFVRRPPKKKATARGKAQPQSDMAQIKAFAWRHRDDAAPLAVAVILLLVTLLVQDIAGAPLWLAGGGLAGGGVLYAKPWAAKERGWALLDWARFRRATMRWEEKERAYAGGLAALAGFWAAWFSLGGTRPLLAYPFMVVLAAWPWWKHRTPHASVPVTIATELRGNGRRRAETRTRSIIDGWAVKARQGKIQGAELLGIVWDLYSMALVVELRHGQSRRTLAYQGYASALESAFDAPENSLRVEDPGEIKGRDRSARLVRLRFLLEDPNATELGPPRDAPDSEVILGRFETGEPVVLVENVHTGIFGASGAGKSGVVNTIIRKLRWRRNVALIGFDLKPGAPEFSKWGRVWYFLADNPVRARFAFQALITAMEERGALMAERGWRKWRATPAEPDIAVFVDEAQELNDYKLMADLERLAGLMRAYGGRIYVATQHPKDTNLPTTVYNALRQIIGLKVSDKADRVVFGENANRDGWMPSRLPDDGGRFLIKSRTYRQPLPARGYWMEDDDVDRENAAGPEAVQLDARTATGFLSAGLVTPMAGDLVGTGATTALLEPGDIVEAELVEETPDKKARVLEAVREGIGTPRAIASATNIAERTVKAYLAELAREGRIFQDGQRKPWRSLD
ncbi:MULTISPECIES: FtsK/SpoIIIE domain-containing protein [unclassified Nonomuraea]|uniref:FtsK/SpoIIIE domain-containing protein n=1 Tax=unclassified Nonomuraea TaxID=2593643 RepID=UPI0033ED47BA